MSKPFENKVVVITGAASGVGHGIAEGFARAGATVWLNDIDAAKARESATELNSLLDSENVLPYIADVSDVSAIRSMIDTVIKRSGRLDVVVANTGVTLYSKFLDTTPEDFDRIVGINIRGCYFTAQSGAKAMIEEGTYGGRIILLSSVTGHQALRGMSAYGVTKASIRHMAKVLGNELAEFGITVNAISPGATVTSRNLEDDPDYDRHWGAVSPDRKPAFKKDIAAAALFLASPDAAHITGQTLEIDGGWTNTSPMPEGFPV